MVANNGNIGHALKDMRSKQAMRSLIAAAATANFGGQAAPMDSLDQLAAQLPESLAKGMATGTLSAAIQKQSLQDGLTSGATFGVAAAVGNFGATQLGQAYNYGEGQIGYVHAFTDQEIEPAAVGSAIDCFLGRTPGVHLKKVIPNLGRAHYFGEEYVKEIDIDLLQKHDFDVQKFDKSYLFHITEYISDVIDKYEFFDERRKLLKSLYRLDLFQKYEAYG